MSSDFARLGFTELLSPRQNINLQENVRVDWRRLNMGHSGNDYSSGMNPEISRPDLQEQSQTQQSSSFALTDTSEKQQQQQHQQPQQQQEKQQDKHKQEDKAEDSNKKPPRRFLAQPIETTSRSSQATSASPESTNPSSANHPPPEQENRPRKKFLPEPVETKTSSHAPSEPRRFKPEIIETEHRSVKGNEEQTPRRNVRARDHLDIRLNKPALPGKLSPNRAGSDPLDSKFSYAALLRRREQSRRHSFRVPELPSIPSNSSEESDSETASGSRSISPTPKESSSDKKESHQRGESQNSQAIEDSGDGEISEYLLSLAAESAQQQLKDQALAAFPNEQAYQHFDHFAIDDEAVASEEEDWMYPPKHHLKSRRQSSADLSWELEYMRHHKEEAEQRLRVMARRKPDLRLPVPKAERIGPSPPMLGGDIILPQSTSPIGTFSNTHDENSKMEIDPCTGCGGLWCGPTRADGGRGTGLWMGTCQKDENGSGSDRGQMVSGIMTPMNRDNTLPSLSPNPQQSPARHEHTQTRSLNPLQSTTPPKSKPKPIEEEFNDGFVTQIYNYLSLGYPCVARYYDAELSKISGIRIEEMRQDDQRIDAKGYVIAPEDEYAVACTRWKALKLYILEWARQQPNMIDEKKWGVGVPERKGSWAF